MKEMKSHIKNKVKESLTSLDNLQATKAPDFFYSRLEARMEAEILGKASSFFWLDNLKFSLMVLGLIFILNFISLFLLDFSSVSQSANDLSTLSTEYFSPADDYNYLINQ